MKDRTKHGTGVRELKFQKHKKGTAPCVASYIERQGKPLEPSCEWSWIICTYFLSHDWGCCSWKDGLGYLWKMNPSVSWVDSCNWTDLGSCKHMEGTLALRHSHQYFQGHEEWCWISICIRHSAIHFKYNAIYLREFKIEMQGIHFERWPPSSEGTLWGSRLFGIL